MSARQARTLWRPVGLTELQLMLAADLRAFPARLPDQPIFYPVCNEEYAAEIAERWNAPDDFSGYAGFVTQFDIEKPYVDKFEDKTVGSGKHTELWVPADELDEFNTHLTGQIRVTQAFYGEEYVGPEAQTNLKNLPAREQPKQLLGILQYNGMDFYGDTSANWETIFTNFLFWLEQEPSAFGITAPQMGKLLSAIRNRWSEEWPPLPGVTHAG